MRIRQRRGGVTAFAMVVVMVITAVVKLLLENKISTSWRKAIGKERERGGIGSRNGQSK
jgi:hypothetical protein